MKSTGANWLAQGKGKWPGQLWPGGFQVRMDKSWSGHPSARWLRALVLNLKLWRAGLEKGLAPGSPAQDEPVR